MEGCPHVNRNDPRCGTRFSLGRLDQAFCVCFGTYHACPMYHRISGELARAERAPAAIVITPLHRHGVKLPLRATGS
jgi:hypothetical protein